MANSTCRWRYKLTKRKTCRPHLVVILVVLQVRDSRLRRLYSWLQPATMVGAEEETAVRLTLAVLMRVLLRILLLLLLVLT